MVIHPHSYGHNELAFLRFFYKEVNGALGPASGDIYQMIKEAWEDLGNTLPQDYKEEDG